ncbi:hypothetical protein C8Q73DRAFT_57448 [Cubamyces lactineus]|nr:hypothetical protein C8Q73DRAFT_57448 [Cubamyces lactineus]
MRVLFTQEETARAAPMGLHHTIHYSAKQHNSSEERYTTQHSMPPGSLPRRASPSTLISVPSTTRQLESSRAHDCPARPPLPSHGAYFPLASPRVFMREGLASGPHQAMTIQCSSSESSMREIYPCCVDAGRSRGPPSLIPGSTCMTPLLISASVCTPLRAWTRTRRRSDGSRGAFTGKLDLL